LKKWEDFLEEVLSGSTPLDIDQDLLLARDENGTSVLLKAVHSQEETMVYENDFFSCLQIFFFHSEVARLLASPHMTETVFQESGGRFLTNSKMPLAKSMRAASRFYQNVQSENKVEIFSKNNT